MIWGFAGFSLLRPFRCFGRIKYGLDVPDCIELANVIEICSRVMCHPFVVDLLFQETQIKDRVRSYLDTLRKEIVVRVFQVAILLHLWTHYEKDILE